MPPVNDNFASALLISGLTGSDTSVTIDTATTETGEPHGSAFPAINQSVWYKWIAPGDGTAVFDTHDSGPGLDDSMDTTLAIWTGTTLTALTAITSGDDDITVTSKVTFSAVNGTTYYIQAGTYGGGETGTLKLSWALSIIYCIQAKDDANTGGSSTVSITVDNWVADTQKTTNLALYRAATSGPNPYSIPSSYKPSFWVRGAALPPPGLYRVTAQARVKNGININNYFLCMTRNGLPIQAIWDSTPPNGTGTAYTDYITYNPSESRTKYTNETGTKINTTTFPNPNPADPTPALAQLIVTAMPIVAGDEIAFTMVGVDYSTGSVPADSFEIKQVCFAPLVDTGAPGRSFDIYDFDDDPLGDSYTGDGLLQQTGITISGVSFWYWWVPTKTVLTLDNGDVYAIWHQLVNASTSVGEGTQYAGPYIAKYASGSWTVVENDVTGHGELRHEQLIEHGGAPSYAVGALDACTDGTNIYIAYSGLGNHYLTEGVQTTGFPRWDSKVFVKKYTPGSGISDLGSFTAGAYPRTQAPSRYEGRPNIKVGSDGSIWVGFVEEDDISTTYDWVHSVNYDLPTSSWPYQTNPTTNTPNMYKGYLAKWTGGTSWAIHEIPPPTNYNSAVYTTFGPIQAEAAVVSGTAVSKTGNRYYSTGASDTQTVVGHNQTMDAGAGTDPFPSAAVSFTATVPSGFSTNNSYVAVRYFIEGSGTIRPVLAMYVNGVYSNYTSCPTATDFGGYFIRNVGTLAPGDVVSFKIGQPTGTPSGFRFYADKVQFLYGDGYYEPLLADTDNQYGVAITMCHHDGPSNNPAILCGTWAPRLAAVGPTTVSGQNEFVYSEWTGSAWSNTIRFQAEDVANSNITISPQAAFGTNGDWGHWQQGMILFDDGTSVWMAADLGFGTSFVDILLVAKLKSDGSEFECPTQFGADTNWGPWIDPGLGGALFDARGNLILGYTGSGKFSQGVQSNFVSQMMDTGTGGWIPAARNNNALGNGGTAYGFLSMVSHSDKLYVFDYWDRWNTNSNSTHSRGQLAVLVGTRTNNFDNVWVASAVGVLILYYYKDGAWHQANSETTRDLYYYKDGTWHRKGKESTRTLQASYLGAWAD